MDSNYTHAQPHAWGPCVVTISSMREHALRCQKKNSQISQVIVQYAHALRAADRKMVRILRKPTDWQLTIALG